MLRSASLSLLRMVVLKELWDIYCCKHIIVAPACRDFAEKSRDPEEARLAQLGGRRYSEWEIAGSNPAQTNTQGF